LGAIVCMRDAAMRVVVGWLWRQIIPSFPTNIGRAHTHTHTHTHTRMPPPPWVAGAVWFIPVGVSVQLSAAASGGDVGQGPGLHCWLAAVNSTFFALHSALAGSGAAAPAVPQEQQPSLVPA
jgi:hypothetical protein